MPNNDHLKTFSELFEQIKKSCSTIFELRENSHKIICKMSKLKREYQYLHIKNAYRPAFGFLC